MTQLSAATPAQIPNEGFLILRQILGDKKATPPTPPIIPVSRTTFLNGIKSGIYPKPIKLGLGGRTNAWRVEDIRNLIANMGAA